MENRSPPVRPQELFAPEHLIVDLDTALALSDRNDELQRWLEARKAKGDPGPVHFSTGLAWTDQSEAELLEAEGAR